MGGTLGKVRRSQCVQEAVAVTSFWDGDLGRPCREGEEGWRGPQGGQTAATFPDRLGLLTRPPEAATPSQGLSAYSTSTVTATLVISSECLEQKKGRDCVIPSLGIGKGGSSDSPLRQEEALWPQESGFTLPCGHPAHRAWPWDGPSPLTNGGSCLGWLGVWANA